MFVVLTCQIQVEHEEELNDRIEELENMGFDVTVEYESEDDEVSPLAEETMEEVEFEEEDDQPE